MRRVLLRCRQHDEVRDEDAVGVQVPGRRPRAAGRRWRRAGARSSRPAAARRRSPRRRRGRAAARRRGGRPRARSTRRPRPRARRRPAGSRSSARGRAPPPRGSPRPRGRRRARARAGRRASAASPPRPAPPARPAPSPRRATSRSSAQQPRGVAGDAGLADALARPDDPDRGQRERLEPRRLEAEVGADVRRSRAASTRLARREPLPRPEHGLVGEVEDEVRPIRAERLVEVVGERHAVVLAAAQLLRPAEHDRADHVVRKLRERVAHDGRVVLAVDRGRGTRVYQDVTSSSIRAVYFSYARVSVENWMIRSCPWNG